MQACVKCGSLVTSKRYPNAKYCSRECVGGYNKGRRTVRNCKRCGSEFRTQQSHIKRGQGIYCSNICKGEDKRKLDGSGKWAGRHRGYLQSWAKKIVARSGGKCVLCGSKDKIEAHHIIPLRESTATALLPMNGVALCKKCHVKADPHKIKKIKKEGRTVARILTIPEQFKEYDTCGNWDIDADGGILIFVTDLGNPTIEGLVALHELVEAMWCKFNKVPSKLVTEFDIKYEQSRGQPVAHCGCVHTAEPGDDRHAPYYRGHQLATIIERMNAHEFKINWLDYNNGDLNG